jgi:hypothetical protein
LISLASALRLFRDGAGGPVQAGILIRFISLTGLVLFGLYWCATLVPLAATSQQLAVLPMALSPVAAIGCLAAVLAIAGLPDDKRRLEISHERDAVGDGADIWRVSPAAALGILALVLAFATIVLGTAGLQPKPVEHGETASGKDSAGGKGQALADRPSDQR